MNNEEILENFNKCLKAMKAAKNEAFKDMWFDKLNYFYKRLKN